MIATCLDDYLAKAFLGLALRITEVWPESAKGITGPAEDAANRRADRYSKRAGMAAFAVFPGASYAFKEGEAFRRLEVKFGELNKNQTHSTAQRESSASGKTPDQANTRRLQRRPPGRPIDPENIEAYHIYSTGGKTDEAYKNAFEHWCTSKGIAQPKKLERDAFKKRWIAWLCVSRPGE